jgi:hypothetical protein
MTISLSCLEERRHYSYNPLKTSRMSFVFFAALVDPAGHPGPFLRSTCGPVGGLVVRRFLIWRRIVIFLIASYSKYKVGCHALYRALQTYVPHRPVGPPRDWFRHSGPRSIHSLLLKLTSTTTPTALYVLSVNRHEHPSSRAM